MELWVMVSATCVGTFAGWWLERQIQAERLALGLPPVSTPLRRNRPWLVMLATICAWLLILWCELSLHSLDSPEVQPTEFGRQARAISHCILATLLILATVIDLDCYVIPDQITMAGLVIAVVGAIAIRDLQIAHLWVDWDYAVPQLRGPHIPDWYSQRPWLHAAAWSLAGALVGGTLTQVVRVLSRWLLGQEAMGLGDVTLMTMIGGFVGWQAVLLIFLLAPLAGVAFAVVGKLVANRPYLPYGPYLALATLIVLLGWSWFWSQTRQVFSDLVAVALLAGAAIVALVTLLLGIRAYRLIPTGKNSSADLN